MKKISLLLGFVCWSVITYGQHELKGTWVLESYTIDSRKPAEIKDRREKDKITFDVDGRYVKRYYEEDLPDGARIQMTYNFLDGKVTKKYFDKEGYEIKVIKVKKKTDKGTYEKTDSDELRFMTSKGSFTKMFKVDEQHLSIADTIDNKVIWSRYKKQS